MKLSKKSGVAAINIFQITEVYASTFTKEAIGLWEQRQHAKLIGTFWTKPHNFIDLLRVFLVVIFINEFLKQLELLSSKP